MKTSWTLSLALLIVVAAPLAEARPADSFRRNLNSKSSDRQSEVKSLKPFQKLRQKLASTSPSSRSQSVSRTSGSGFRAKFSSASDRKVTAQVQVNTSKKGPGLFQRLAESSNSSSSSRSSSSRVRIPHLSPLKGMKSAISVRTTAYTHSESDHLVYGRKTAVGSTLRSSTSYTSAAADWSRFPIGTTFKIVGEPTTYVVDDYGSALVGTNTIDIYRPTRASMNRWGVRNVSIKIIKMGSFERSKNHLAKVTGYWHTRAMYRALS
ncbi:MAG: 3D domain-containing protein [Verrucomicrobiota bacterium]